MIKAKDQISFILKDKNTIKNFISIISPEMFDYINLNPTSKFVLFYKYLTHSDLATFGKATKINSLQKNLLYYITESDMENIQKITGRPFQTAHQSNIGIKSNFYSLINLPQPRTAKKYRINNHCDVKLVNSNMEYFTSSYTQKVFNKLGKKCSWDFTDLDIVLSKGQFTDIDLNMAVHGPGRAIDVDFHKIRHHLFKGDTLLLLFEEKQATIGQVFGTEANTNISSKNNLFILFEKNPVFFSIIGTTNKSYEDYQKKLRDRLINNTLNKTNASATVDEEVTRQQQSEWRKMLANEILAFSNDGKQALCPFTWISADYDSCGALFVASHIKGFSDVNTKDQEKYDINNGLLLCANADALFDRHLISVNKQKQLVFSYLIDSDIILKQKLQLLNQIFLPILNDKRMKFLEYHFDVFNNEEIKRKNAP